MSDKLSEMFRLRSNFMLAIKERYPSSYPDWPVDVTKKRSQKALRETALKGVEEMSLNKGIVFGPIETYEGYHIGIICQEVKLDRIL